MKEGTRETLMIGVCMIGSAAAVIFSVSPLLWAIGKWHCWWFATAPVCV